MIAVPPYIILRYPAIAGLLFNAEAAPAPNVRLYFQPNRHTSVQEFMGEFDHMTAPACTIRRLSEVWPLSS